MAGENAWKTRAKTGPDCFPAVLDGLKVACPLFYFSPTMKHEKERIFGGARDLITRKRTLDTF